eukprot:26699_1
MTSQIIQESEDRSCSVVRRRKRMSKSSRNNDNSGSAKWKKFQLLKKQREAISYQSKIRESKRLTKNSADRIHTDKLSDSTPRSTSSKQSSKKNNKSRKRQRDVNDSLELLSYLDPNPQLKGVGDGKISQKSPHVECIKEAIRHGDLKQADELNEELVRLNSDQRLNEARQARKYHKQVKKKDDERRKKKRKKLNWGDCFEVKRRWETKGNM